MRTVTRPGDSVRSSWRTATCEPCTTVTPRATSSGSVAGGDCGSGGAISGSERAWRRASRTVRGRGSHPARRPSSTSGGATGESTRISRRLVDPDAAVTGDEADPVGERDHALEPVLGEEHRQAEVVDQARDGREDLLGRRRVEGGGGLVEDQHAGVGGQHRPDGDALLLTAREGAQVAGTQVGDAQQVERLLDAAAHRLRSGAELLHAVGELLLDRVGDEPGERVLADVPDEVRPLARRLVDDAAPVEQDVAGEHPAGEARHEAGDDAEERGLADAGAARDEDQLALLEREVDAVQHLVLGVAEADVSQLDHTVAVHTVTSRRTGAVAGTGVATAGSAPSTPSARASGDRYGTTVTLG